MNETNISILTVDEVAEELRIGKNAVYNLLRTGKLHSIKNGRTWLVPTIALEKYILNESGLTKSSFMK